MSTRTGMSGQPAIEGLLDDREQVLRDRTTTSPSQRMKLPECALNLIHCLPDFTGVLSYIC